MRIAVCEAGPLTPTQDAGSRAVVDLIEGYRMLGHEVEVFIESHQNLPARVAAFAPHVIVGSRPGLFVRIQPALKPLGVPIVYMAHDLHFVRIGLQGTLDPQRPPASTAVMRLIEKQCFEAADLAIVPTESEVAQVGREFPGARCIAVNYFAMPTQPDRPTAPREYVAAFVGGAHHAPNRDGVHWFITEIWTTFRERHDARMIVCGLWGPEDRAFAEGAGVEFTGVVSDAELDSVLGRARVGIAPLRFGAGMKRKTLHYLSHGLPVIGTSFAVQGLAPVDGEVPGTLAAETPHEFETALEVLRDDHRWLQTSAAASAFIRTQFSTERHLDDLKRILALLR